ncbi:hypothetical protein IFR05_008738 [Cadophora sp. M221]|nr:hypothetical protein IFR05_008738 [Cadophora sp. M221]
MGLDRQSLGVTRTLQYRAAVIAGKTDMPPHAEQLYAHSCRVVTDVVVIVVVPVMLHPVRVEKQLVLHDDEMWSCRREFVITSLLEHTTLQSLAVEVPEQAEDDEDSPDELEVVDVGSEDSDAVGSDLTSD